MRDLPFSSAPLIRWPGFVCALAERAHPLYWLALVIALIALRVLA